jgi:hypothetical protein
MRDNRDIGKRSNRYPSDEYVDRELSVVVFNIQGEIKWHFHVESFNF